MSRGEKKMYNATIYIKTSSGLNEHLNKNGIQMSQAEGKKSRSYECSDGSEPSVVVGVEQRADGWLEPRRHSDGEKRNDVTPLMSESRRYHRISQAAVQTVGLVPK